MGNVFQCKIDSDGIARMVFDLPGEKVNTFSLPVLQELEKNLDELSGNKKVKFLAFLSGKEDSFIAGADLRSFSGVFNDPVAAKEMIETGHRVFNKIAALPFPTIALIHGVCVGGGLEFALACTYRIATDHSKTQMGLPEVTLGIIPGWGGTQRVPRLVGLMEGLNLILTGKSVNGKKAFKIHLVDALVAWEFKEDKLNEFIDFCLSSEGTQEVLAKRKPKGLMHWLIEANPLGRAFLFYKAKKDVLHKTKGHYPAPLLALKVVEDSCRLPLQEGLNVEKMAILDNLKNASDISRNLIHLFFTSEALKKDSGVSGSEIPAEVKSTGVLGAGIMGSGIAWVLSKNDYAVRLKDIDYTALGKGFGTISELYHKSVKDKKMKKSEAALKFQHVSSAVDYSGFENLDLVVEAATENLELKNKLFVDLESTLPSHSIIATNTSSLGIAEMAQVFKSPERFIGMHFFNPVPKMPLVEVVPGKQTSPKTIATAVALCKKIGKTPIVVGDCAGFLVNRIFMMGANELMFLFEEGVEHQKLDAMMLNFGYPMGPFALADEVGIDVMYKVSQVLEKAYGDRMKGATILQQMYEKKLLGKKGGEGFYTYQGKKSAFNPKIFKLLQNAKRKDNLSEIEMNDRVMLGMINEAARCLDEGIVKRPDYLDMAMIMGTGFPPFRGGLLKYADTLGINYIVDHLDQFQNKYGMRFTPSRALMEMKNSGKKFYS